MSKETKKEEKEIIPDQLNIIIRTSIPGYQIIEYKPSMTIKNIDSNGVQFNPLIKLDKSKISKIPDEYRIKQFFNRGLFQSLLNYNGGTPAKNITYATRAGYVDNNIKVTLDTIFPVNSVIYVGKNPYAIGDVQWTSGDWKIDIKQKKEEIDISKITDPKIYSQLVREEIISGEQQLDRLPQSVLSGNNYSGPPIARGIKQDTTSIEELQIQPVTPPITPTVKQPITPPVKIEGQIVPKSSVQVTQEIPPQSNVEIAPNIPPEDKLITSKERKYPIIQNEPYSPNVEELDPREREILEEYMNTISFAAPIEKFSPEGRKRRMFRDFFIKSEFYDVANNIYKKFPPYLQEILKNFYRLVTQPKSEQAGKGINLGTMYYNLCDQFIFINSPGDGDCFFKAVSDGINIYNYGNEANKIIYSNIYGKTQLFTIKILRDIVLRYYNSLEQEEKNELKVIADTNVDILNSEFENYLRGSNIDINNEEMYKEALNHIYKNNETFLVYKPSRIPINIDEYSKPFRTLTEGEIQNYIKSKDYWGDQFAIKAICNILGIYIIPIEKFKKDKDSISYRTIVTEPNADDTLCSKRVLFLYRDKLHYELILFKYKYQVDVKRNIVQRGQRTESMYFTIFDINTRTNYPAPYHILILLYGSNYIYIPKEVREKYIYKNLMYEINSSATALILDKNQDFINNFNKIFNMKNTIERYIENDDENIIKGGQPPNRYSPYRYPPYGYPSYGYPPYGYPSYQNKYITKKPEERNMSKIAYSITIDMEVHPGTSLTPEQINQSQCKSKYNAIRKAFAEFTGKPYVIPPVYKQNIYVPVKNIEKSKFNNTKKNVILSPTKVSGKKNITIKRR